MVIASKAVFGDMHAGDDKGISDNCAVEFTT